jgi:uncharacterized C2H2 Zn-finger protein
MLKMENWKTTYNTLGQCPKCQSTKRIIWEKGVGAGSEYELFECSKCGIIYKEKYYIEYVGTDYLEEEESGKNKKRQK